MHIPRQGAYMENKIVTPHSGASETSRKRKLIAVDKKLPISEPNPEYGFLEWQQHETGPLSGRNAKEHSPELFLNQSPESIEPITFRQRSEKTPFDGQKNLPVNLQTSNGHFCKTAAEIISNACSHRGSLQSKVVGGGTLTGSNWQYQTSEMFIQAGEHKNMSEMKKDNEPALKTEFCPGLQAGMPSKIKTHLVKEKRTLQHNREHDGLTADLGGKECSFKGSRDGTSGDLKQTGPTPNSLGINVVSTVGTGTSVSFAFIEHSEKYVSQQTGLLLGSGCLDTDLGDDCKMENDRGHGDGNIQIMEEVEGLEVETSKHSFMEGTAPRNGDCPATMDIRLHPSPGSFKSDNKSKSTVRKVAPKVAEKLWDGSLRLNSSVTVFAVAFFKSGEKMTNIKWSESVEVKGKVRLEAFEKYIQDLPRSRNRGLMVISLCWKEGSSESGLAGMKKVAKGYKEGERVGFAQLSPGIDLYICPRSETIITILAKHGFFKGMAAVEDNQNSLIGCVVWRRNRGNSRPVIKKSEKKNCSLTEPLVNSPSDSFTQRVDETNMPDTQPVEASILVASGTDCSTPEIREYESVQKNNAEPSSIQLEVHNPPTIIKPLPVVPSNSVSVSAGVKISGCDGVSHQSSLAESLVVEAPQMHDSALEKPKPTLELQRPLLSPPSDVINKVAPLPDDDDLPEFDFGTPSGDCHTLIFKPQNALTTHKKLPAEGFRNTKGSLPLVVPAVESLISNHRRLENTNVAELRLGAIQKKTPLKNFWDHTAQTIGINSPSNCTTAPCPKNHFHEDDDDMPEWHPPDVELHKQSVQKMYRPSVTVIDSKVPISRFQISAGPPRPPLPSPYLVAIHPPFSSQALPLAYNCQNTGTVRPLQPRQAYEYMQRGPSSLIRFNSKPVLRPSSNPFDFRFPNCPAGSRSWRS